MFHSDKAVNSKHNHHVSLMKPSSWSICFDGLTHQERMLRHDGNGLPFEVVYISTSAVALSAATL